MQTRKSKQLSQNAGGDLASLQGWETPRQFSPHSATMTQPAGGGFLSPALHSLRRLEVSRESNVALMAQ